MIDAGRAVPLALASARIVVSYGGRVVLVTGSTLSRAAIPER